MALLTDTAYVIQQIRLAALHNDRTLAERVIMPNGPLDGSSFNESMYEYVNNGNDRQDDVGASGGGNGGGGGGGNGGGGAGGGGANISKGKQKEKRQSRNPGVKGQGVSKQAPYDNTSNNGAGGAVGTTAAAGGGTGGVVVAKPLEGPMFQKVAVAAPVPAKTPTPVVSKSALAELIKTKSGINNAYSDFATYCGKGENKPIRLVIWLPFSSDKKGPLNIVVKTDATVENVIGYTLYEYTDQGRQPMPMDILSAYSLRIVEDNGIIDDDFPALERTRMIEKFSFDQFALVEAPRQQVLAAEQAKKQKPQKVEQLFLKVHMYSTLEIKQTSTIQVASDQLVSEVLKVLCEKHKLNSEEYTLRMADTKTDLPATKTIGELNISLLCLMKKNAHSAGDIFLRPAGESSPDDSAGREGPFSDITVNEHLAFKKYNVMKRQPMFGGRQERVLAIDGDVIYNMPSENSRSFFDSPKTTTIKVDAVVSIEIRSPSVLKLVYRKERDHKVYELETQTPEEAEDIVQRVSRLMTKSASG